MRSITLYKTPCVLSCFQPRQFKERQHDDLAGCRAVFSTLISMFVCDILRIPSGCIR